MDSRLEGPEWNLVRNDPDERVEPLARGAVLGPSDHKEKDQVRARA